MTDFIMTEWAKLGMLDIILGRNNFGCKRRSK